MGIATLTILQHRMLYKKYSEVCELAEVGKAQEEDSSLQDKKQTQRASLMYTGTFLML